MTGTADLARRPNGRPSQAGQQGTTALAIRGEQTTFDDKQRAALVAMGVSRDVTPAELAVFFHQCRRTGLDPFIRQIYLIHRRERQNGEWVAKPTTQTGIDGYRLIRDRIARREGIKVEYEPTIWWDSEGGSHEAWLWDEYPAACTVAIRVDDRRYGSTLRFKEYAQYKDRDNGVLNSMWAAKPAHMIEKCAEADVLRRAFPQDLSGLVAEDETDPDDYVQPQPERPRVTPEQIRQRRQPVQATVVPEDVPPAETPADPPQRPAGGTSTPDERPPALAASGQVSQIQRHFRRLGIDPDTEDGYQAMLTAAARITGLAAIASLQELTQDEAGQVIDRIKPLPDDGARVLWGLLEDGVVPDGE